MSKSICAALAPALFSIVSSVSAQPSPAPPQPAPEIKANVNEVLVDMVVRDKKGKPVYDLKPDEVTITDNGVRQSLTSFRLVQGREAIANNGARTALDPLRQIRLVTLAFEGMGPDQRQIARNAAVDMIKGEQGENVYYSVVAIATQLQVLQPFTMDKEALKKAIDLATSGVSSSQLNAESDRVKQQLHDALRRITGQDDTAAALRSMDSLPDPGRGSPGEGSQALQVKLVELMLDMSRFDATVTEGPRLSLSALESLVSGLSRLPGRKSVLYFTWGLIVPPHLDEQYHTLISTANRANVTFYSIDTNGVMTWRQNAAGASDLARASAASARTATKTGAVSLEEIKAADTAETSMRNNTEGALRDLAESTGGFLVGDSNDLRTPLRHINEEINSYYEASYNPGIQNYDGSFRKVKVEVSRKDVVVHARTGYFALPLELRSSGLMPFEVPLLQALSQGSKASDVDFHSQLVRFQPLANGIRAAVVVETPLSGLAFSEDRAKGVFNAHLSLVALVKDQNGQVVRKFTRDMPLQGAIDKLAGVKEGNFVYKDVMTVPPGKYTLETAVMDRDAGKLGVRRAVYYLTAVKGVSISNISLVRSYQAGAEGLDPTDPFQFQGGRVTPTLTHTVKSGPGATLSMFFIVYPDPANPAKPGVELEYVKDGKVVGKGALELPPPDANGRIPYIMSSSAAAMPPGDYEIRATAKQGAETAEETTTVQVAQ